MRCYRSLPAYACCRRLTGHAPPPHHNRPPFPRPDSPPTSTTPPLITIARPPQAPALLRTPTTSPAQHPAVFSNAAGSIRHHPGPIPSINARPQITTTPPRPPTVPFRITTVSPEMVTHPPYDHACPITTAAVTSPIRDAPPHCSFLSPIHLTRTTILLTRTCPIFWHGLRIRLRPVVVGNGHGSSLGLGREPPTHARPGTR
jgi:hypothetical protein